MPAELTIGSLFSGIGGFDLGLERTGGFRTVWFCEQDAYCQRVLARHWPDVPIYDDVRTLSARMWTDTLWSIRPDVLRPVDVLCGGFPCQDVSVAGTGLGIAGAKSGLWSEYARLIRELGPRYVVVENVSALLARGLGTVLGDLAALGYDAEWDCIPASAVGAPHQRDRIWIVAYPNGDGRGEHGRSGPVPPEQSALERGCPYCAPDERCALCGSADRHLALARVRGWAAEPDVGRVADGVPARVDRVRALGNTLVPQIAEWIGHRILDYEGGLT